MSRYLSIFLALSFLIFNAHAAEPLNPQVVPSKVFEDPWFRVPVDFWTKIYTQYTTRQGVLHDSDDLGVIYEVLEVGDLSPRQRRKEVKRIKKYWQDVLLTLDKKSKSKDFDPTTLEGDYKKVYELHQKGSNSQNPKRFLEAAGRRKIRLQLGQRDEFERALTRSGPYLAEMEKIVTDLGLPVELSRLPFLESSFNLDARSKVGAYGIWQFMPRTARGYLKMNSVIDERRDPLKATQAAAHFLKGNYEALESWPLAIIAYNHGRAGMVRAVRKIASVDLRKVIEEYEGRRFGFASRNFYLGFVAALEVERNAETYFGKLDREPPILSWEVGVTDPIRLPDLAAALKLDMGLLKTLNPGLKKKVFEGKVLFPPLVPLRIPQSWGTREAYWKAYVDIPASLKHNKVSRKTKKKD